MQGLLIHSFNISRNVSLHAKKNGWTEKKYKIVTLCHKIDTTNRTCSQRFHSMLDRLMTFLSVTSKAGNRSFQEEHLRDFVKNCLLDTRVRQKGKRVIELDRFIPELMEVILPKTIKYVKLSLNEKFFKLSLEGKDKQGQKVSVTFDLKDFYFTIRKFSRTDYNMQKPHYYAWTHATGWYQAGNSQQDMDFAHIHY